MSKRVVDIGTQSTLETIVDKIGDAIGISCFPNTENYTSGNTFFVGATGSNDVTAIHFNNEIYVIYDNMKTFYRMTHDSDCWKAAFYAPYTIDIHETCILVYDNPVTESNEVHLLGGYGHRNRSHYKWDGKSWSVASELPYDFCAGKAVVFNGELHIFGGGPNHFQRFAQDGWLNYHYKWDGASWEKVSEPPFNLCGSTPVVHRNTIKLIGGISNSRQVYKFNGSWSKLTDIPNNITGAINASIVSYDNIIHVLGGTNSSGIKIGNHITYDDATGWENSLAIPTDAYGDATDSAVVANDVLWIIGYRAYSLILSVDSNEESKSVYNSAYESVVLNTETSSIIGDTCIIDTGTCYIDDETVVMSFDGNWANYMGIGIPLDGGIVVNTKGSSYEHLAILTKNSIIPIGNSDDIKFLSDLPCDITNAAVSTDPDGNIHIVSDYNKDNTHYKLNRDTAQNNYATYELEGGSRKAIPNYLSNISSAWHNGHLHVIGYRSHGFMHYRLDDGGWTPITTHEFMLNRNAKLIDINGTLYAVTISSSNKTNTLKIYRFDEVGWIHKYSYVMTDLITDFDIIEYYGKIHIVFITSPSTSYNVGNESIILNAESSTISGETCILDIGTCFVDDESVVLGNLENKVQHCVFSGNELLWYEPFDAGACSEVSIVTYDGYVQIFISNGSNTDNYCIKYHINKKDILEVYLPKNHQLICNKNEFIPLVGMVEESNGGYVTIDSGVYKFAMMNSDAIYSIA